MASSCTSQFSGTTTPVQLNPAPWRLLIWGLLIIALVAVVLILIPDPLLYAGAAGAMELARHPERALQWVEVATKLMELIRG